MRITHTVQTDDGSVRLNLGDGDTIFDLIAQGANGQLVTVHLGYSEARTLLADAAALRLAFGAGQAHGSTVTTMGGVTDVGQPEGEVAIALPARCDFYTLTVCDGARGRTAFTVTAAANDSLILGLGTILSQL
jgi:hypothetical protein